MSEASSNTEAISLIEELVQQGFKYPQIAERTGVSRFVVMNVAKGKTKRVPPGLIEQLRSFNTALKAMDTESVQAPEQAPEQAPPSDKPLTRDDYAVDREIVLKILQQNEELIKLVNKMIDEK